ncbi:HupE/UreJ protein [Flavobacterium croceum DSM 17960]|uniref:HupE/UreJ protein n=1 Tax=Flavobacterium croceum DSM 17960 TaxID=1121886 RepID=A0A2S4NBR2_9FLAO|nr:HupE/UreJ family protein [Flavobacterium croceum]POS03135.1 HupE/UreJ protein [Flavobacterium croceum DSM 17960]
MSEFWVFFQIGLYHVLDLHGYDHVLFLIVLTAPYTAQHWKKLLTLVSLFTLGHTLSLLLAVFDLLIIKSSIIEVLILATILLTGLFNLINQGKNTKNKQDIFIWISTLFFGLIHGFGFSTYFKGILSGEAIDKLPKLLEFALGIEAAQIVVVVTVLILAFIMQTLFKFNKRDFTLTLSSFVMGVTVALLLEKFY